MTSTFNKKLRNKIAYRLLLYILLFSGVVTIIITATQLYIEYQRDIDAIDDQFARIETSFEKPLIDALWFYNKKALRLQLEGISNLRDIEYLELVGEGNLSIIVGQKVSKHTITNQLPLIYTGKNINREIGSLTIVAGMTGVYSRLFDRLITILITHSIIIFLIATFIYLLNHFLVFRHIASIDTYLKMFSFKVRPQLLELKRKSKSHGDELDHTVSLINEMSVRLFESYDTINSELFMRAEAEKQLQKAHNELEQIVVQRTKSLKEERDRAQNYLDVAGVMLMAIGTDQKVFLVNKRGCEILGYNEREIIGKNWFDSFLYADDIESVKGVFDKLMSGDIENVEYLESKIRNKKGQVRFIAWHNILLKDDKGDVIGTLSSGEDITGRKQAEENLRISRERLKMLNKIIRHDLSNDFTVINSAVKIFQRTSDTTMFDEIAKRANKSLKTIASYREYESFIDSNIGLQEIKVNELINEIITEFPKVEFNVNGDCKVFSDDALYSVFTNLITNSIKHGNSSKIDIIITTENDMCRIKFMDNGTGIPDKIKDKIFDEGFFYGKSGHTGIGLHIAKNIIANYGGSISVENNQPNGATFNIILKKTIK